MNLIETTLTLATMLLMTVDIWMRYQEGRKTKNQSDKK